MPGNDKERVGFVGIGTMGVPMTANLAKAGFPLTLYDVDASAASRQAEAIGCTAAADLAALAAACDIVVTMLPTGRDVANVAAELAQRLPRGALLIDMSSSDPTGTRRLGPLLAGHGIALVDAPVSGAVQRALTATLTIMIGGDDGAAVERARPVLAALGEKLFLTGPLGSGHAMKALNNFVAAAGFAAASEALIIGERFGLDPAVAVEIFNVSTGRNFSTELTLKTDVLTGTFASGFALGLMTKDVKAAADLAATLGMQLPIVAETSRWWDKALADLGGDKDHSTAFLAWKNSVGEGA